MRSSALFSTLLLVPFMAHAANIDTGNADLSVSWNNTLRYNWARRMQSRDPHVALAGPAGAYDQGDYLFDEGDTISNRIDLLTEFNLLYRDRYGMRVTAAGWYDHAYGSRGKSAPGLNPSYANNQYTDVVKRYYRGPSGEFLDAYVFGNFSVDDVEVNLRAGRHAVVWGEGLFGNTHSIAYSQAPNDSRKAVSSPGASAKETALPIKQLSATALVTDELTLLGQYQFEWLPNRYPEGGTYFGPADVIMDGPNVGRAAALKGDRGAYGLGIKYSPASFDATVGLYYRKFDDMGGWASQVDGSSTRAVFVRHIELWGVTLAKNIAGVSVAAELSHRHNGPLVSSTGANAGATGGYAGAIGDTWHGVVNGVATFGSASWFDTALLSGEVSWAKLDRITRNAQFYRSRAQASSGCGNQADIRGCVDGDFIAIGAQFAPSWQQVLPGVDLSMPIFFSRNFGNSPSNAGGSDGFSTGKVGLSALAYVRHQFDLSYTWFDQKIDRAMPFNTGNPGAYGRLLGAPYADKDFLSFTYQTTF